LSKRIVLFLFAIIFLVCMLVACGASTSYRLNPSSGFSNQTAQKEDTSVTADKVAINNNKIIIKNAKASITVKNSEKAIESMSNWVSSNGGYEFSRSTNVVKNNSRINVVYKIKPDKLQTFINMLKEQGEMTSCDINSDDITEQYYDASARLGSLKSGREQFLEILKKANTIDEILKVQDQINKISGDIESLQGKINMWDKMVAESTVELTITEESDPIKNANINWNFTSFQDIFKIMKNGFVITSNMIINLISWIFIIIVSLIPLLVLGVIVLIIIMYIKKRKKRN